MNVQTNLKMSRRLWENEDTTSRLLGRNRMHLETSLDGRQDPIDDTLFLWSTIGPLEDAQMPLEMSLGQLDVFDRNLTDDEHYVLIISNMCRKFNN